MPTLQSLSTHSEAELLAAVQQFMAACYEESYVKGGHDADAAKILQPFKHLL